METSHLEVLSFADFFGDSGFSVSDELDDEESSSESPSLLEVDKSSSDELFLTTVFLSLSPDCSGLDVD